MTGIGPVETECHTEGEHKSSDLYEILFMPFKKLELMAKKYEGKCPRDTQHSKISTYNTHTLNTPHTQTHTHCLGYHSICGYQND